MNNSKVNCLLLVSSLNLNIFITYKCTIVSPPWQHLSLYGVICLSKKIMLFWTCCIFGRSLELLGMQLLFNWDQQPVLAWSQSWASSHQKCLLEPGDQGAGGQVIHSQVWPPRDVLSVPGDCAGSENRIFLLLPEKEVACHPYKQKMSGSCGKCSPAQWMSVNVWMYQKLKGKVTKESLRKFLMFSINRPGQNVLSFPKRKHCRNEFSCLLWLRGIISILEAHRLSFSFYQAII